MRAHPAVSIPSLAERALELRSLQLEGANVTFLSGRALLYRFHLAPSEFGRTYECELRMRPGAIAPEMYVLKPDLIALAGEAKIPHFYPGKGPGIHLCLWRPKKREWSPQMRLSETYLAWTAQWLWYFEDWLATGTWNGGGEHLAPSKRRWGTRARKANTNE